MGKEDSLPNTNEPFAALFCPPVRHALHRRIHKSCPYIVIIVSFLDEDASPPFPYLQYYY